MGNSESTDNQNGGGGSDPPNNNRADEESVGFWQKASNAFVYIESAVYIVNHLFRIYNTIQKNNTEYTPHNTPIYIPRNRGVNASPTGVQQPSAPLPVIPEGEDEPVEEDTDNDNECIICTVNKKNTLFRPCNHIALCIHCSREYYNRNSEDFKCVICKQMCSHIEKVYMA
jgi:hypothetical protein